MDGQIERWMDGCMGKQRLMDRWNNKDGWTDGITKMGGRMDGIAERWIDRLNNRMDGWTK